MTYNKISSETKAVLTLIEDTMENKSASLEKKIAALKKDLTAAKKHKLSKTAQKSLELDLKNAKHAQKNLLKTGFKEILNSEVDRKARTKEKVLKNMIKKVDTLFDHKLNTTVFKCLCELSNFLKKANDKEQKLEDIIKKANPQMDSDVAELVVALEVFGLQEKMCKDVESKLSGLKIKSLDNIAVNDQYPLITRRSKLAQLCVKSAREEWASSTDYVDTFFDVMEMMSMFICDARNHYNLGVQILHGSPQSIEAARSMDTASRDGIPEDVWGFARDDIYDNEVFGPKALKIHRQKMLEKTAVKLNKKIHKEIGAPEGRKSGIRKI